MRPGSSLVPASRSWNKRHRDAQSSHRLIEGCLTCNDGTFLRSMRRRRRPRRCLHPRRMRGLERARPPAVWDLGGRAIRFRSSARTRASSGATRMMRCRARSSSGMRRDIRASLAPRRDVKLCSVRACSAAKTLARGVTRSRPRPHEDASSRWLRVLSSVRKYAAPVPVTIGFSRNAHRWRSRERWV